MRVDMIRKATWIEQEFIQPDLPWTEGQGEWMDRKIREGCAFADPEDRRRSNGKRHHDGRHDHTRPPLRDFKEAGDVARRSHAPRISPQDSDFMAGSTQPRFDPPYAGADHLALRRHRTVALRAVELCRG